MVLDLREPLYAVSRYVCCTSMHGRACARRGRKSCFLLSIHFTGRVGVGCGREGCNSLVGVSFVSLFRRLIASRISPGVVDCSQEVPMCIMHVPESWQIDIRQVLWWAQHAVIFATFDAMLC